MFTKRNLSAVALALAIAAPLAAQSSGEAAQARRRAEEARQGSEATQTRRRVEEARQRTEAVLTRARVDSARNSRVQTSGAQSRRIPRGHLPPRGMCRVWIDGVAPGQQPAVTSCAQAEQDRLAYGANARVIYGDDQSFPGRGKGKFKNSGAETQNGVFRTRDDDDDDRFENDRRGQSAVAKAAKADRKAGKKGGKGRG